MWNRSACNEVMKEILTRHTPVKIKEKIYRENAALPFDGFRIKIDAKGAAEIHYRNARARKYAEDALKEMETIGAEAGVYADHPDFMLRGLVEGFYGTPYSWETRRETVEFLARHKMNAYFYAPKDDLYHREKWREPYPKETLEQIAALNALAEKKLVDFYFCLSPGKDFRFSDGRDFAALCEKFAAVRAEGIKNFALFMDDIDPKLSEEDARLYGSAGRAHAALIDRCVKNVPSERPWLFCPTEYMQNFDTEYRKDFREAAETDFIVFWTGYNTVAEAVGAEDGERVKSSFSRRLALWDNYPVNDFEPKRRLYLGAVKNRSPELKTTHVGYVANPMPNWEASKFALISQALYCWDGARYSPEAAERTACAELAPGAEEAALSLVRRNGSGLFGENYRLRARFAKEDRAFLDGYYEEQEKAVGTLERNLDKKTSAALGELFRYMLAEAKLYREARAGAIREETIKEMSDCAYRTQDQSLLEYVKENYGVPAQLEEERRIWWKTEEGEDA